ncbi:uncharacterized protein LOC120414739 isoform X1 [Culex pipiens pallens]|uniref:uncharacterized protein LOC120414739 isoform X1 n=1 Tax=Culex pipiens pallens TaxID=42434 RepID=UPI001953BDE5|nr:uncharacterized protein LOC120414739 isoform X1 [Culex pipiens pallens]
MVRILGFEVVAKELVKEQLELEVSVVAAQPKRGHKKAMKTTVAPVKDHRETDAASPSKSSSSSSGQTRAQEEQPKRRLLQQFSGRSGPGIRHEDQGERRDGKADRRDGWRSLRLSTR